MSFKNTFIKETETTYSFSAENGGNPMTFTIKKEFLKTAHPLEVELYDLMLKHNMQNFLHNQEGPALVEEKTGRTQFWFDGKEFRFSEAEKKIHDFLFNKKIENLIENE